jgi:hypothetical protein
VATAILGLNTVNGGTPQARRSLNATSTATGVGFGSLDAGNTTVHRFKNKLVKGFAGGPDVWIATTGDQIYRSTNAGGSWSSVLTFSPTILAGSTACKTGLHVIDVSGTPTICLAYPNAVGTWYAVRSTNGTSWSTDGPFALSAVTVNANAGIQDEIQYRNVLYFGITNSAAATSAVYSYDPSAGTASSQTTGGVNGNGMGLVVWMDRLFLVQSTSTTNKVITEILSGSTALAVTLSTSVSSGATGMPSAWVASDGNLYAHVCIASANWRLYQVTPQYVVTDKTSMLPAGMTSGGTSGRSTAFADTESNPGSFPSIYIYYSTTNTSGTIRSMYEWNGPTAELSFVDSGGDVLQSLGANVTPVAMNYSYTSGQNYIRITGRTFGVGYERWSFVIHSSTGTDVVGVKLWTGKATDPYPTRLASIGDPSNGSISSNTNTGLTANGTTVYQFSWYAIADGYSQNQRVKRLFEVLP